MEFLAVILAYILGSIPFGVIVSKIAGKGDVRKEGSKNIGATNVTRVAGKKWGILTFILDGLKGAIALLLAIHYLKIENTLILNLIAIAAVLGHIFPVWLKFKGGKGVATGLLLIAVMKSSLIFEMAVTWILIYYIFRMVSLASIFTMLVILLYQIFISTDYNLAITAICLTVIFKHHENIKRIMQGEELVFKEKNKK